MSKILLFYKYTEFEYPKRIQKWQMKICQELGLTGRIIIAHEGINGTVGGSDESVERYKKIVLEHPQLQDMDIKEGAGGAECFPNLRVVVKDEIVNLGLKGQAARINNTGVHLTPEQTHKLLSNRPEDLLILDTRNEVESAIGAFEGAIKADITHFREFPQYIDKHLDEYKDKKVLMYCTGGVRCERATAYLKEKGIAQEVYQIEGGIHRYAEQYPDGYFRGKNYVFDGRIAVKVTDDILGSCTHCNKPCDDYTNCLNASCNKHHISCTTCLQQFNQCCSSTCKELILSQKVKARPAVQRVSNSQSAHGECFRACEENVSNHL